jgi:hypothetical protein
MATDPGTVRPKGAADVVERAELYPFQSPRSSYVYCQGHQLVLVDPAHKIHARSLVIYNRRAMRLGAVAQELNVDLRRELRLKRYSILAYGSNPSVETLKRKFDGRPSLIPAIHGVMRDFDVVYSAHFYAGTIPATLQYSSGTSFEPFVLHLTRDQLEQMHLTESLGANYRYVRLRKIKIHTDDGDKYDSIATYVSIPGALRIEGSERAVADVAARGRHFPALTQLDVQDAVRQQIAPSESRAEFMRQNAVDSKLAIERASRLEGVELNWRHLDDLA